MLTEMDVKALVDKRRIKSLDTGAANTKANKRKTAQKIKVADLEDSLRFESDIRSAAALQGAYHNLSKEAHKGHQGRNSKSVVMEATSTNPLDDVLNQMIAERTRKINMRSVFNEMDEEGTGKISAEQFIAKYYLVDSTLSRDVVYKIFLDADHDNAGYIDYDKFLRIADMPALQMLRALQTINRPRSLLQVEASSELYFGERLRGEAERSVGLLSIEQSQHFSMELYEGRIASMQRFVAMCVIFHEMGKRVENFFSHFTFGLLGYRYDRTHSIMRIATTASPVSGADVRERTHLLKLSTRVKRSLEIVSFAWHRFKQRKTDEVIRQVRATGGSDRSRDSRWANLH